MFLNNLSKKAGDLSVIISRFHAIVKLYRCASVSLKLKSSMFLEFDARAESIKSYFSTAFITCGAVVIFQHHFHAGVEVRCRIAKATTIPEV